MKSYVGKLINEFLSEDKRKVKIDKIDELNKTNCLSQIIHSFSNSHPDKWKHMVNLHTFTVFQTSVHVL